MSCLLKAFTESLDHLFCISLRSGTAVNHELDRGKDCFSAVPRDRQQFPLGKACRNDDGVVFFLNFLKCIGADAL